MKMIIDSIYYDGPYTNRPNHYIFSSYPIFRLQIRLSFFLHVASGFGSSIKYKTIGFKFYSL